MADKLLTLSNVEVIYDKVFLAIRGVSLDLAEGQMIALLGANGAGKSTTLKAISGLLAPERGAVTHGDIQFCGESILAYNPPHRVQMGMVHVLEGRHIFEHMTPDENLYAAWPGRRARTGYNALRERVYGYFPRLGERLRSKAGYLSGGEQQRVAVARAVVNRPLLLLADEPTGNLDPETSDGIMALLSQINRGGTTVVMSTHNARAVDDMRRRVIELHLGKLMRDDARGVYGETR